MTTWRDITTDPPPKDGTGYCEACSKWKRDRPRDGKVARGGTCYEPKNMVFFGAPEEENPIPNMNSATWAWHTCVEYSPLPPPPEGKP